MSRAKDRARAESGVIFRDGKLVNKEDWYKAHPTREMLAVRQTVVKSAVKEEMAKKFQNPEVPKPEVPNRYYCTTCRKHHIKSSKIGSEHTSFYLAE